MKRSLDLRARANEPFAGGDKATSSGFWRRYQSDDSIFKPAIHHGHRSLQDSAALSRPPITRLRSDCERHVAESESFPRLRSIENAVDPTQEHPSGANAAAPASGQATAGQGLHRAGADNNDHRQGAEPFESRCRQRRPSSCLSACTNTWVLSTSSVFRSAGVTLWDVDQWVEGNALTDLLPAHLGN